MQSSLLTFSYSLPLMRHCSKFKVGHCLLLSPASSFSYYIHLKDHNSKMNRPKHKNALSYQNPKQVMRNTPPVEMPFNFKLKKKDQRQLERKMFEQYKIKLLKGQIDQQKEIEIDPLWGQEEKPVHFYQNFSKNQLMSVSSPQNQDFLEELEQLYKDQLQKKWTPLSQVPDAETFSKLSPEQLVDIAVLAFSKKDGQHISNYSFWYYIQQAIGNRFYELNNFQLIQLMYTFKGGFFSRGTQRFSKILRDLLSEQIILGKLSKNELKNLYYALRNSKRQGIPMQQKIEKALQQHYGQMEVTEKILFLFTYTLCRRPQDFSRSSHKIVNGKVSKASKLLFKLGLPDQLKQHLSIQLCSKLVFSIAKLQILNCEHITSQIIDYLTENFQLLLKEQNKVQCYKIFFYLQEINGMEFITQLDPSSNQPSLKQLNQKMIAHLTSKQIFHHFSKVQQTRIIYSIWNCNLLSEEYFELYKGISLEVNSTILYYFCQIELSRSSQREWEILKCLAALQSIPLPYYQSYKRFYNYMSVTTDWDLQPIREKLLNAEQYQDVRRMKDTFQGVATYNNLLKYFNQLATSSAQMPLQICIPIDNVELSMFAISKYQISIDILKENAFVPGTSQLKQFYRNKRRSLENIGWKHIFLRESQLCQLPVDEQVQEILFSFGPYVQEQQQIIQTNQFYRAEQIQQIRNNAYWDGMTIKDAEGYRNDPVNYAKMLQEKAAKEKALTESILQSKAD